MPLKSIDPAFDEQRLFDLAKGAAEIARNVSRFTQAYSEYGIVAEDKDDGSPVTLADNLAELVIIQGLKSLDDSIAVIGEEMTSVNGKPQSLPSAFWLVDPIDGTKYYCAKGRYTVNIGLVVNGLAVAGAVAVPTDDKVFFGAIGCGSWCLDKALSFTADLNQAVKTNLAPMPTNRAINIGTGEGQVECEQVRTLLAPYEVASAMTDGGASKFTNLLENKIDAYARTGGNSGWDTAAGHALVLAAGGSVTNPDGSPMLYDRPDMINGPFIVLKPL